MQEFLNWTIDTVREDRLLGSWLEEKKFEWTSIVSKFVTNIIDLGYSNDWYSLSMSSINFVILCFNVTDCLV